MTRRLDRELGRAFLVLTILVGLLGCDSGNEDALPATPTMMAPADDAVDQKNALELQWHPVPDAETYHVQVAGTEAFSTLLVDEQGIEQTFLPLKDLPLGTTLYWHVRTRNPAGFGAWSTTWSFTPSSVAITPARPALMAPTDGATSQPTTIIFRWEACEEATTYHIQVALEPDFLRRVADLEGVRYTDQKVTGLVHTYTYYWRIRAGNPVGYGSWSPTWRLVIEQGDE